MQRCAWCGDDPLYQTYHDEEWGVPVHDDQKQFEFLILESAQAGLSWITILRKREGYREAYEGFDPIKVAAYDEDKIQQLMQNQAIVRNERKIRSSIKNAISFLAIQEEFGTFSKYLWGFVDNQPIVNHWVDMSQLPTKTELSVRISKDLKKRGFSFVGPTTIYAHLQATGLVNDHVTGCFRYKELNGNRD
jgi:DNA-3-methyladenine glycosylase I